MSGQPVAPIIVKRKKVVAGGHHGGAWKVAHSKIGFVAALRFARVGNFDHKIDIRTVHVAVAIGKRMGRIEDPLQRALTR